MAKQNSYEVATTFSWAASTTGRVSLPLSGYITHIDYLIDADITGTGALVATEDAFFRILRGLRIKSSGARTFVDFTDGRQWKWYNVFQYNGQFHEDAVGQAGAVTNQHIYAHIPLHLGLYPDDVFDTSVVIPAVETTDLVCEIEYGVAADLTASAGFTLNSLTITMVVHEIALAAGESRDLIWKEGLMMPRFENKILTVGASYSNLGLTHDLPVGDTLHRLIVQEYNTAVDARGLRGTAFTNAAGGNLITDIGFKLPKNRETPWERSYRAFVYEGYRKYKLPYLDSGAAVEANNGAALPWFSGVSQLDGALLSGRALGIDLSNAVTGDAQLAFSTSLAVVTAGVIHLTQIMFS